MLRNSLACILVIDDHPDEIMLVHALNEKGVHAKALHPDDLTLPDLSEADLVLVDFQLDEWVGNSELSCPIAQLPPDGLALAAIIRRYVVAEGNPPTSIAILTGKLEQLAHPLVGEHRQHILAQLNGLEWVFAKAPDGSTEHLEGRLTQLADATKALPQEWECEGSSCLDQLMTSMLGVSSKDPSYDRMRNDVSACLPPIHNLSSWDRGIVVLRWLLHRILPYPCFLWDRFHLAARLGVSSECLQSLFEPESPLRKTLAPCEFSGVLSSFLGRRWWRSKVEQWLWDAAAHSSADPVAVKDAIEGIIGHEVSNSAVYESPVVCLDASFQPFTITSMKDCVRLQPDDWPAYADTAWTTRKLASEDEKVGAAVHFEDRDELNGGV